MTTNPNTPSVFAKVIGRSLLQAKGLLDSAVKDSTTPFGTPDMLTPRFEELRYGWTHYGLFFANLPEPHRYLNIMILLGAPSALAFDQDFLYKTNPRQSATLFSGTAASEGSLLKAYVIGEDCIANPDGSDLTLGTELKISGKYPKLHIHGEYQGVVIDFLVQVTDQVSWFIKNVVYDHLSLLATYQGTISHAGQTIETSGLCTYEYARSFGMYNVFNKPIAEAYKIPLNFFTYQVINLDEDTQILLTKADILNQPAAYTMHVRHLNGEPEVYTDVLFEVAEYQQPVIGLDGHATRLPQTLRWLVKDAGKTLLDITGDVDTEFRFGHGRGYAGSYRFSGEYQGQPALGRGYIEYVDIKID